MRGELGRVLVVDDDADLRSVVATRLAGAGYHVYQAAGGAEAIEKIRRHGIEALLLDIRMPGMSGFDVLATLREFEDPPAVLFLSALGERDIRLRALHDGAQDFLGKPFDPEELVARTAIAVGARRKLVEMREESLHDALTGLENRRAFDRFFPEEVARARRYRHSLALLLADADGLKAVNDAEGHAAGDEFLRSLARAIRDTCRETDRSFRIGGDEFAILLPEAGAKTAERFFARLGGEIATLRMAAADRARPPSASMGLAIFPEDAESAPDLLAAADRSLYEAKHARVSVA